ncbi:MAG: heavy metal translocating P-type ATPase [Verrucomicrobiota bacterium]|nr:heavy metal translocating P-type ATPase [Verrucomicrobiota bacterium]MDD8049781.1 heavy metal translocating P-type ATPase [Verrucomicrobiota bacterium]
METLTRKIDGLDCAQEVRALRETVGKLEGVGNLNFNLLKGTMTVSFIKSALGEAQIDAAVEAAGLKALPFSPDGEGEDSFWHRNGRKIMCTMSGGLLIAGFTSHASLHGSWLDALAGGEGGEPHAFPPLSVMLYIGAVMAGGWYVLPKAWMALRRLRADMNLLMSIAVIGAMAIGEYFEASAVAFLFSFSLLLESWSVGRARRAIEALMDLSPQTARYRESGDGPVREAPVAEVPVGATVLVRPGEKIPLDGVVIKGSTSVNQAPITGESIPVGKKPDDEVYAGTINEDGAIEFRSSKPADDTTLARIVRMVEDAQERRAPAEQWVEKFARYYTPSMIILAMLIALVPPLLLGGAWGDWFYQALVILVIACPCALVISTPVSIVAALASSARAGVLIKGGAFLEGAARLKVIALDKTGTITHGQPEVQEIIPLNNHKRQELLELVTALESYSEHPLARAILRLAEKEQIGALAVEDFQAIKGKGASGTIEGTLFWLGSHRLLHEKQQEADDLHQRIESMEDAGHSVVIIGNDKHVCGLISVADRIRKEAPEVVEKLKSIGIERIVMLTGDNRGTAEAIAHSVGIDDVRAELLPEDKQAAVEELVRDSGNTAMVGDGINDAPALAAASLGIAMGTGGTDAAIETADIALMSDDFSKIPWLIQHAQRTLIVIRQNIFFALGLKALFMVLAVANIATLWMAIAADMGASLVVIVNGLRLLRGKKRSVNGRTS